MSQTKCVIEAPHVRQLHRRAIRRELADITPEDSYPQRQSPLFSILPPEIRLLIFEHALCQQVDYRRPVDTKSTNDKYRPGHTHHTALSTPLLLTCRLVYYEAHAIPLRSATHHLRNVGAASLLFTGDIWLHHISKQRGSELYHLHDILDTLDSSHLSRFLLPHLKWKKITWTICTYIWPPPPFPSQTQVDKLLNILSNLMLPSTCQEVTLELETRVMQPGRGQGLKDQALACRQLGLLRSDGSCLNWIENCAVQYTWFGGVVPHWGQWSSWGNPEGEEKIEYRTIRLVWRSQAARREYMSYDHLDCLSLDGCSDVKNIAPLFQES